MPRPKKQITKLVPGMPEKPGDLSEAASRHWDRLLTEMQKSGITLLPSYRAAIALAATLMADREAAWGDIQKCGRYVVSKTGVRKLNPAVLDMAKLNEQLGRALYALGLTPKSLGGNAATKPKQEKWGGKDELEAFLSGDMSEDEDAGFRGDHGDADAN